MIFSWSICLICIFKIRFYFYLISVGYFFAYFLVTGCEYSFYIACIYYRILVPDGRHVISYTTMIDTINRLYSEIGYSHRVTGKSAKYLGVSTAFARGLTNDEIRLLGRWKSCETPQHYRQVDPGRLHRISCVMNLVIASDNSVESSRSHSLSLTLSSTARPASPPQQVVPEPTPCPLQPALPSSLEDILVPVIKPWTSPLFSGPKWELCPFTGRFLPPLCPANNRRMRSFRPAAPFCPPKLVQNVLVQKPLVRQPLFGSQLSLTGQLPTIMTPQPLVAPQTGSHVMVDQPLTRTPVPLNQSKGLFHTTIEFPVYLPQPLMQPQQKIRMQCLPDSMQGFIKYYVL